MGSLKLFYPTYDFIVNYRNNFIVSCCFGMLYSGAEQQTDKIGSFISSLSVLNFLFALTMNVFGYTIFYLLEQSNIPILYGGIGTSIGQVVLLFILIPQGRLIDKGKSYFLMIIGAVIYSISIILIFLNSLTIYTFTGLLMSFLIGIVLVTQNTFKSSLSSFIGKAVKLSIIGKHYSRIVLMEMIGGAVAMFTVVAAILLTTFRAIYLVSGAVLLVTSLAAFFVLFPENRKMTRDAENKTKRPGFIESLSVLKARSRFIAPILLTKIFMAVGVYVVSYFFIISGQQIGVDPIYAMLALGVGFGITVPSALYGEKYVDNHPKTGKAYVVILALLDLGMYAFLALAFYLSLPILFYLSLAFSAPGPLFVAGGMSYELKIIGKEYRGMFAAIQRTLVGITFIVVGVPFAILFSVDYKLIWLILLIFSVGTVLASLLIPSADYVEQHYSNQMN